MIKSLRHYSGFTFQFLTRSQSGMAATEFALILPILIALFFGVVESSDALSANRRVNLAVNTLSDLAAQESKLYEAEADDLFRGVEQILGADSDRVIIRLVSVVADKNGEPVVHWSYDNQGGRPYAENAPYKNLPDSALWDANATILVGEISYTYRSALTHHFIPPVNFNKSAIRWPRQSLRVQFCSAQNQCTS